MSDHYEAELDAAAATLQRVLPIGQIKGIGLREVAAGVEQLAAEVVELRKLTGRDPLLPPEELEALIERAVNGTPQPATEAARA